VLPHADLVLNLCGVNPLRPWIAEIPVLSWWTRIPRSRQIRHLNDERRARARSGHNRFFTFAENSGNPLHRARRRPAMAAHATAAAARLDDAESGTARRHVHDGDAVE
jgi:hypothetical protein